MDAFFTAFTTFTSLSDFLSMGKHGVFVWASYGLSVAVILINVALPILARRRYLQDEARRLRREKQQ
ncbi:heme exporter protein CcmD [Aquipseudomonas campi]|uniref:Heme exporter protein D n=1 Tax=Aquipseudomonas campi TaxID=2731681 RepID=A0A6M8GA40_9GAMM|nr:heme exporter protein CcmD [Pseudomonas campi]QKE65685.1 heme exporter protein CcmD [Pseudomonas campi]